MSFKKPIDKNSINASGEKVRLKNSYYTFSKEYPFGDIKMSRKASRRKHKNKIRILAALSVVCFVVILSLAFFVTDTAIKFSYKPESQVSEIQGGKDEEPTDLLSKDSVKALYMDYKKLSDKASVKAMIKEINKKDCNSVFIDFKAKDGHLAYSSKQNLALVSKCAVFDNETVRSAIKQFSSANITVVAGIYCFEDDLVSSTDQSIAVKYLNTEVNWLDDLEENSGHSWLNPYSKKAKNYIKAIVSEVYNLGARGFVLRSVCFPNAESLDSATFPGERNKTSRNKTLEGFVDSVKSILPADSFLLVEEAAEDIISGNEQLYSGSLSNFKVHGILADTSIRSPQYFPDKKSRFSSMLSMFYEMNSKLSEGSKLVALINEDDYSSKYIKTLRRNGYDNYIITAN